MEPVLRPPLPSPKWISHLGNETPESLGATHFKIQLQNGRTAGPFPWCSIGSWGWNTDSPYHTGTIVAFRRCHADGSTFEPIPPAACHVHAGVPPRERTPEQQDDFDDAVMDADAHVARTCRRIQCMTDSDGPLPSPKPVMAFVTDPCALFMAKLMADEKLPCAPAGIFRIAPMERLGGTLWGDR